MNRRNFIRDSAVSAAAISLMGSQALGNTGKDAPKNLLPRWRGFNLLDYFSPYPARENDPNRTMEDDFRWMADWGFDFVRIPMAYPRYLEIDRTKQITGDDFYKIDKAVIDEVEKLVLLANKYKLHVSLNLHRAPGYCINAGFYEPYNLWKDKEAQDAFNYHWGMWAERFKGFPKEQLSFDLLNEPAYRE